MEFDTDQATYDFYNKYGRIMGFSIRRESSGKNKRTGELTSRIFSCAKEGFRAVDKRNDKIKRPRAETRTGCGAHMGVRLDRHTGKFYVYTFVEQHNHPLVKKEYAHMLPSQRKMIASQATEVDLAEESGIPLRLAYELISKQAGGRESLGFIKQDQKNYLRTVRQKKMAYGEVGVLLQYFSKQILENPSFFYELHLNKEEQITNMFWADAKMIIDYSHFGDVNACKNVNTLFRGEEGVHNALTNFFDHIEEESEFVSAWYSMLDEYNAHENDWLATTFKIRKKWAYAYVRRAWSIGIRSTQISESFNARLKNYLKSDLNIVQFFTNFERVLTDTRYKEWEAEYDLQFRIAHVKFDIKMLKQAREVYTKAIFKLFQDQFEQSIELSITNCVANEDDFVYTVELDDKSKKRKVKREGISTVYCSCRLFEIKGILCSHAIKVLREAMFIKEILEQYIVNRWSKEAKVESVVDMCGHEIQVEPKLQQAFRYRSLCSIFTRLSTKASENVKAYQLVIKQANKLAKMVEDLLHLEVNDDVHEKRHTNCNSQMANCLENVHVVIPKGFKKKEKSHRGRRRIMSALEKALPRKKKSNQVPVHMFGNNTYMPIPYHPVQVPDVQLLFFG
ncbi:protein FAR1-RELATED SEQUENCE 5-like [Malus domestica]|uniref:protein FAR1-RELATED SEQUENCE 5-like n=1 Tax=Malus domestica TaxID=3750 RepID=UPI003976264A